MSNKLELEVKKKYERTSFHVRLKQITLIDVDALPNHELRNIKTLLGVTFFDYDYDTISLHSYLI